MGEDSYITCMSQQKRLYRYAVKNWRTYNEAFVQRGSLTMWMPADWLSQWETQSAI